MLLSSALTQEEKLLLECILKVFFIKIFLD